MRLVISGKFKGVEQLPKNSMQQLSGFNSYWFIPEK